MEKLIIDKININIKRKKIKNLYLRISASDLEVNISAPNRMSDRKINEFIALKLNWIKKSLKSLSKAKILPKNRFINGETHQLFGEKRILEFIEYEKKPFIEEKDDKLLIYFKKCSKIAKREKILDEFYRKKLKEIIPDMIKTWEEKMDLKINNFGIKKMKTRWGTCNTRDKRIWINLELAKKPIGCLESIVVHEMVHLFERRHNKRFYQLMDKFMPNWREFDKSLK